MRWRKLCVPPVPVKTLHEETFQVSWIKISKYLDIWCFCVWPSLLEAPIPFHEALAAHSCRCYHSGWVPWHFQHKYKRLASLFSLFLVSAHSPAVKLLPPTWFHKFHFWVDVLSLHSGKRDTSLFYCYFYELRRLALNSCTESLKLTQNHGLRTPGCDDFHSRRVTTSTWTHPEQDHPATDTQPVSWRSKDVLHFPL